MFLRKRNDADIDLKNSSESPQFQAFPKVDLCRQFEVIVSIEDHPIMKMMAAGLNFTLHTDDPSISQITLGHEYQLACETFGMSQPLLSECILAAARGSFLLASANF